MQILTLVSHMCLTIKSKNQIIARNKYYNSYKLFAKNLLKKKFREIFASNVQQTSVCLQQ